MENVKGLESILLTNVLVLFHFRICEIARYYTKLGTKKMPYLGIFGSEFEKAIAYLKSKNIKFCAKTRTHN